MKSAFWLNGLRLKEVKEYFILLQVAFKTALGLVSISQLTAERKTHGNQHLCGFGDTREAQRQLHADIQNSSGRWAV